MWCWIWPDLSDCWKSSRASDRRLYAAGKPLKNKEAHTARPRRSFSAGVHRWSVKRRLSQRNPQTLDFTGALSQRRSRSPPHFSGNTAREEVQAQWNFCFGWFFFSLFRSNKNKKHKKVRRGGLGAQLYATAAGKYAAHKPCLIASNLNFTSLQKSHRDSLQVMTNRVASCVVTPYIPNTLSPACGTHPPCRQWMPNNSCAQSIGDLFLGDRRL